MTAPSLALRRNPYPNPAAVVGAESRQPSWPEVLDAATGAALRSVHTAMLGTIKSYSSSAQTAAVELATHMPRASGEYAAVAPLADVPVIWPGAWAAGDRCLVVFLEESAAKWLETGSVEGPEVQLRHGLHPVAMPFPSIEGQATDFVALAEPVTDNYAQLKTALDGLVSALDGLAPGTSLAWDTAMVGWPADIASAKVKAR